MQPILNLTRELTSNETSSMTGQIPKKAKLSFSQTEMGQKIMLQFNSLLLNIYAVENEIATENQGISRTIMDLEPFAEQFVSIVAQIPNKILNKDEDQSLLKKLKETSELIRSIESGAGAQTINKTAKEHSEKAAQQTQQVIDILNNELTAMDQDDIQQLANAVGEELAALDLEDLQKEIIRQSFYIKKAKRRMAQETAMENLIHTRELELTKMECEPFEIFLTTAEDLHRKNEVFKETGNAQTEDTRLYLVWKSHPEESPKSEKTSRFFISWRPANQSASYDILLTELEYKTQKALLEKNPDAFIPPNKATSEQSKSRKDYSEVMKELRSSYQFNRGNQG